ncbi:MAG: hypothetical protein K8R13_08200 [Methanococcoides sp.]|nr:hypothetical protein [Methanococcoides sp.]
MQFSPLYIICGVVQNQNKGCGGTAFVGVDIIETKAGFVVRSAYIPSFSYPLLWTIFVHQIVLSNSLAIYKIAPELIFNNTSLDISKNGSLLMAFVGLRSIY